MKMSIKCSVLAVAIAATAMAQAQSNIASPFGTATASAASISKAQARAALSAAANKKVERDHLNRLLDQESNEFIVVFKDEAPARAAVTSNHAERLSMQKVAYQATRKRVRAELNSSDIAFAHEYTSMPWAVVRVKSRAALVKLMNHSATELVVENIKMKINLAQSQALVQQPNAVTAGRTGAGTTVVTLDGGVDITQAAFGSCTGTATPASCRVVARVPMGTATYTPHAHGTNVAGIVAGVASGTRIASIDVLTDAAGHVDMVGASRGIDWAITNRDQFNIVAVNMSFGVLKATGACDSTVDGKAFSSTLTAARAAGIVPVVSSGNEALSDAMSFPACVNGAVSVGALYDANVGGQTYYTDATRTTVLCTDAATSANAIPCFSNSNSRTTLFAPGASITAAGVTQSGTSQAAPHVAAAAAILRAPNAAPADSVDQTVTRLVSSGGATVTDTRNNITKPRLSLLASLSGLIPDPTYRFVTQQVYLGYFGRPADVGGLFWFADRLRVIGAPSNIVDLEKVYSTNAAVRELIDSFGTSAESNALYGGDNTAFVTAIYWNLFNRAPDSSGLNFWVGAINNGSLSRGKAALSIMAASMPNADGLTVNQKASASVNFTRSLDLAPEISAYSGMTAAGKARDMLKLVNASTNLTTFQTTIDTTISNIVSGQ